VTDTGLPVNVAEFLSVSAAARPDQTAIVDQGGRLSYRELDERVDAVAAGLAEIGLVAGNRVLLTMENSAALVTAYLAMARSGIVAVPLDPTSSMAEFERVLSDSGARACIADDALAGPARAAVADLGTPVRLILAGVDAGSDEIAFDALAQARSRIVSPRDPEALAVLMYTSGTSGRPRAVMLSHRALVANVTQAAQTDPPPLMAADVVLGVVAMSHVYGLNAVLGQVICQGATLVVESRFDPEATLELIARESVTVVPVAPPAIAAWLRTDVSGRLASVRVLLSGAGPLQADTARAFEQRTGLALEQGYGLTEAAAIVTTTLGVPVRKPGSVGRALPGVQLRVVDETGGDAEPADPGEIQVRGASLFSGYWPDGEAAPGADGWLSTGDVGLLDADGDLFLVDRLTELVVVSGFNVYPSEVEKVVLEVDGVRECAVIGVPDDETGEAVVAQIVVDAGQRAADVAERVRAHANERLARFKVPRDVDVVDELPRSATGKVAKGRLRAAVGERRAGGPP
jgi:long-chain acyl-CoA synthetase